MSPLEDPRVWLFLAWLGSGVLAVLFIAAGWGEAGVATGVLSLSAWLLLVASVLRQPEPPEPEPRSYGGGDLP